MFLFLLGLPSLSRATTPCSSRGCPFIKEKEILELPVVQVIFSTTWEDLPENESSAAASTD
jgi:hypothetical protein